MRWFCPVEQGPASTEAATCEDDPVTSAVPPSSSTPSTSTPTSSIASVTLDAIMEQLQQMHADFGGCLDYLTDEMC